MLSDTTAIGQTISGVVQLVHICIQYCKIAQQSKLPRIACAAPVAWQCPGWAMLHITLHTCSQYTGSTSSMASWPRLLAVADERSVQIPPNSAVRCNVSSSLHNICTRVSLLLWATIKCLPRVSAAQSTPKSGRLEKCESSDPYRLLHHARTLLH